MRDTGTPVTRSVIKNFLIMAMMMPVFQTFPIRNSLGNDSSCAESPRFFSLLIRKLIFRMRDDLKFGN